MEQPSSPLPSDATPQPETPTSNSPAASSSRTWRLVLWGTLWVAFFVGSLILRDFLRARAITFASGAQSDPNISPLWLFDLVMLIPFVGLFAVAVWRLKEEFSKKPRSERTLRNRSSNLPFRWYVGVGLLAASLLCVMSFIGSIFGGILTNSILESQYPEGARILLAERLPSVLLFDVTPALILLVVLLFASFWWVEILTGKSRDTQHYVLWWLSTVVVIALTAIPILNFAIKNFGVVFLDPLSLLAIWTVLMLIVLTVLGTENEWYKNYVRPHRGIWISFLATVLLAFVLLNYSYNYVTQRITGMLSARHALIAQLQDADASLTEIEARSQQLNSIIHLLRSNPKLSGIGIANTPTPEAKFNTSDVVTQTVSQDAVSTTDPQSNSGGAVTPSVTQNAVATPDPKFNSRGAAPPRITRIPVATLNAPDTRTPLNTPTPDAVLRASKQLMQQHASAILARMEAANAALNQAQTLFPQTLKQEEELYASVDLYPPPSIAGSLPLPDLGVLSNVGASPTPTLIASATPTLTAPLNLAPAAGVDSSPTPTPNATVQRTQRIRQASSILWASALITDTKTTAQRLEDDHRKKLDDVIDWSKHPEKQNLSEGLPEIGNVIENQLLPAAQRVHNGSTRMLSAVNGVEVVVTPIVIVISLLMTLFVILPWSLLLLFLFRQRDNLATGIIKDLIQLAPQSRSLLKRALDLTDVEVVADAHARKDEPNRLFVVVDDFAVLEGDGISNRKLCEQVELLRSVSVLPVRRGDKIQADKLETGVTAFNKVREALVGSVFSNFEYILTLTGLTLILGVGWYLIFYPNGTPGLAIFILQNTGIVGLTEYLTKDLTPITVGFIGAYLWVSNMLLRRYFYGDLYPTAFMQGILRFVIVFLLSLILNAIQTLWSGGTTLLLLAAFMAGIFPDSLLRYFAELVNRSKFFNVPLAFQTAPLTKLDGLDVFIESRLLEENIVNVQGMATASIQDLVVHTYFPTKQIVDWIDQAILYIHCGVEGENFKYFQKAGIRNATDLLDRLGYDLSELPEPVKQEKQGLDPDHARLLAETIRSANQKDDAVATELPASLRHATVNYFTRVQDIGEDAQELDKGKRALLGAVDDPQRTEQVKQDLAKLQKVGTRWVSNVSDLETWHAKLKQELDDSKADAATVTQLKNVVEAANTTSAQVRAAADKLKPTLVELTFETKDTWKAANVPWQAAITEGLAASQTMLAQARLAYDYILARYPPPPLTLNQLLTIADVMLPDQNLPFVLNWYAWAREAKD